MAKRSSFDVIVLGAGPGGYVAAIRTSQLGLKTAIVEAEDLGGVCLNWGCIPTKALLKVAEGYLFMKESSHWGFKTGPVDFDWETIIKRSRDAAGKLSGGVSSLMRKNKITVINGWGKFVAKDRIAVTNSEGEVVEEVEAPNIIIATGARAASLPNVKIDGKKVISSREAMVFPRRPDSLVIIGAGAIGLEFAFFYAAFDTKVTVVEYQPRILPFADDDCAAALEKSFKKLGMKINTSSLVKSVDPTDKGVKVTFEKDGQVQSVEADACIMAVGVRPNVENIGLEAIGVEVAKTGVKVDGYCRTNVPGIYAIGDVIGPPALAHAASAEALVAAETIGKANPSPIDYSNVPSCIYCQPQVAGVGLTEREAKAKGLNVKVGKFPFLVNGKSVAIGEKEGFVKIIADAKHGEILGAHIVGSEATELIGELVMAKANELTIHEVHKTIHAHPTLSEATMEASAVWLDHAIHI